MYAVVIIIVDNIGAINPIIGMLNKKLHIMPFLIFIRSPGFLIENLNILNLNTLTNHIAGK